MKKNVIKLVSLLLALALILAACGLEPAETITADNATEIMDNLHINVSYSELVKGEVPEFVPDVSGGSTGDFMYEMPSISNYPLSVEGAGDVNVEIFVPQEENLNGLRDFFTFAAGEFNVQNYALESGESISVSVRSLEAKLAEDYIMTGSYRPEAYVTANELYGCLLEENGIEVDMVTDRTVGNTMGIVFAREKYEELCAKYGELDVADIVEANLNGDVAVGYTNPTNNATGLNFVISMLSYFDANNPMSMEATTDFSNFQNAVPVVSYSTSQMITALSNGRIDAFVLESQIYESDTTLTSDYVFMPFGVRHDNPIYAIGELTDAEHETLRLFADFLKNEEIQQQGTELGFNRNENYKSTVTQYSGGIISSVLEFWQTEKSAGKQIVAVFVADKSGSMAGERMDALKSSLKNAMQYVGEDSKVGLMSYTSHIDVDLPIGEFNREQQEYFVGAIDRWKANGNTATNDAIIAAIRLINEEKAINPEIKPIIFLLSDGVTTSGYYLQSVIGLIDYYDIPIYTIGYEADVDELERIAAINDGAFIDASSDDIGYIMKTLFDAEM